ncbi:MAG: hypothetical protein AMS25_09955 [Gemmatimonas sp. SM23_52]|nr:MAG: hypothetical protein AMS25_09955 [Gemmatimonas sp. SM23_52]
MCNDRAMSKPAEFRPELKRPRKRLRIPILRALLLALALVPYSVKVSSGPVGGEGQLITTRTGSRILQGRLRDQARRYFDIYAMIIPWRVKLELR